MEDSWRCGERDVEVGVEVRTLGGKFLYSSFATYATATASLRCSGES